MTLGNAVSHCFVFEFLLMKVVLLLVLFYSGVAVGGPDLVANLTPLTTAQDELVIETSDAFDAGTPSNNHVTFLVVDVGGTPFVPFGVAIANKPPNADVCTDWIVFLSHRSGFVYLLISFSPNSQAHAATATDITVSLGILDTRLIGYGLRASVTVDTALSTNSPNVTGVISLAPPILSSFSPTEVTTETSTIVLSGRHFHPLDTSNTFESITVSDQVPVPSLSVVCDVER